MFSKEKSLFLLLISSVACSSAYATVPATDADRFAVYIPDLKPGFEYNIGALFLQAGASNLNYVILNKELPVQSPVWYEQELHPSFAAAFELGVGYTFPKSGQNIQLQWTHLESTTSSSTQADNATFFLGPDYEIGPAGVPIRDAQGTVKFRYDVVNFDAGQFVNFGQHVDMRFFGGLSTGFLRQELIATYSGTRTGTFAGPFSMTQDTTSNFTGIGPRAGIHVDYNCDNGVSFLGEAAGSALAGSMYSNTSYTGSAVELMTVYHQAVNHQNIKDQLVYQIIPGFDAKLGIKYKHTFRKNMFFTVALGYQTAVYINAISQYIPGTLVTGEGIETGGVFVGTMRHVISNYSVQGPFLNFALNVN